MTYIVSNGALYSTPTNQPTKVLALLALVLLQLVLTTTLLRAQTLLEELIYFAIRYIPSMLVCIGCHAANLYSLCSITGTDAVPAAEPVDNSNTQTETHAGRNDVTCHLAFGNV